MCGIFNIILVFLAASIAASPVMANTALVQPCEGSQSTIAPVYQVYPTADILPENLLRFYIYFSEPMMREGIWDSIVLLDENGNVVPGAFIENRYDLWSPDDTRLTVLFDPGRVKTGLIAHNTLGRSLEAGKNYTLKIKNRAKTRNGCYLTSGFEKHFTAIESDFDAPDLNKWQIQRPSVGTKEPLRVKLDGSMDHVSLAYRIQVIDHAGMKLGGALRLGEDEKEWIFTPMQVWSDADYHLEVHTILEDIAGNRLTGLFDRPLATIGYSEPGAEVETLTFTPHSN